MINKRIIKTDLRQINKSGIYETNCNSYIVTRKPGTSGVSVDNYPLSEGESLEFGGNIDDFYSDAIRVTFDNSGSNELYIFRRFEHGFRILKK